MPIFYVWGEYGPCAGDYESVEIETVTKEQAIKEAVETFKTFSSWNRMGLHNIYVREIKK